MNLNPSIKTINLINSNESTNVEEKIYISQANCTCIVQKHVAEHVRRHYSKHDQEHVSGHVQNNVSEQCLEECL